MLSLFAVITVQKNTRDLAAADKSSSSTNNNKRTKEEGIRSFVGKPPTSSVLLQGAPQPAEKVPAAQTKAPVA